MSITENKQIIQSIHVKQSLTRKFQEETFTNSFSVSNILAANFKLIKNTVLALFVYDVRNLLAFIPI